MRAPRVETTINTSKYLLTRCVPVRAPRVANDGVLARLVPERVRAVANGEHSVIEVIHLPGALLIGYLEVLIGRLEMSIII